MRLQFRMLATLAVASTFILGVPAPAGAKVATGCAKTYKVVKNDSWSRIADKSKVSMSLLLKVNKATTSTLLLIGDVICLPKAAVTQQDSQGFRLKAPPKRYTAAQSRAIIREVFPDRLEARAIAIAERESHLNAASYNSCCIGLFQIHWLAHKPWLKNIGITSPEQLLDARVNAEAALALYKRSNGWAPWRL